MEKVYDCRRLHKFHKKLFIICRSEHEETSYTYGRVLLEVKELLEQFRLCNIASNTGIALLIESHTASSIVLLLSILNHNSYFIPLKCRSSQPNFESVLNSHGAKYVISHLKYDSENNRHIGCLRVFNNIMYLYENIGIAANRCEDGPNFCYSIATSGTTGKPKIVQVPYSCVEANIDALSAQLRLTESEVIYLSAPLTFDPFVVDFFLALNTGTTLLVSPATLRLDPNKLINVLWPNLLNPDSFLKESAKSIGTTLLQLTPSLFRIFGTTIIRDVILHESSSLRSLILGGEDFPPRSEWNSWLPALPIKKRIFNIYGITELSCWCTMHECNFYDEWDRAPLGKLLDDQTKLRIINKSGEELFGECEGQLEVGSATRKCYIPSLDGQYRLGPELCFRATGDSVRRDKNGNVYYFGRIDSVIKRMGIRLNLERLQQNIQMILKAECRNVKCIWQEDTHKLICVVESSTDELNSRSMHIRRLLMENLIEEERPDDIKLISQFPLNSHGKVDYHCLLQNVAENIHQKSIEPLKILHRFITQTLGLNLLKENTECAKNSSIEKTESILSFTAAGGTSLQAITLTTEIGAMLEHKYDQSKLLEMLLNPQHSLISINDFLATCSISKSQFISKELSNKPKYEEKVFKFIWRTDLRKCVDSSPILVGNKWICVGSHSHILATLDGRLGSPIAVMELPDRIECRVEVVSNNKNPCMAIVGCYDHNLYAFNYANGRIYWSINLGGMIKAKPLSFKSRLVLATYGDEFNLLCVCLKTNYFLWRKKIGTKGIFASPASLNGSSLIVCTLDGTYCNISVDSGECLWLRKFDSPIFSSPIVIAEENIFILAEVVGNVHICSTENGTLIKSFCAGSPIFSGLATVSNRSDKVQWNDVRSRKIWFGCYDKHIYCLQYLNSVDEDRQNYPTLDIFWKVQLDSNIFASPIAFSVNEDKYVLSCSTNGLIVLLLAETGEIVATHKLNGEVFSTPCNLDNRIFVGCRDNYVYSFDIN